MEKDVTNLRGSFYQHKKMISELVYRMFKRNESFDISIVYLQLSRQYQISELGFNKLVELYLKEFPDSFICDGVVEFKKKEVSSDGGKEMSVLD
jgi:hypothetical protein